MSAASGMSSTNYQRTGAEWRADRMGDKAESCPTSTLVSNGEESLPFQVYCIEHPTR